MPAKIKVSGQWKDISKIFIKVAGQWKTVQQGFIKVLGQWKQIFVFATNPTQSVFPSTPSGTGAAGTAVIVGSAGSYTNYLSISTSLVSVVQGTSLTDGLTTSSATVISSTHTVTQLNATTPPLVFYTRDAVVSLDGVTTYYYYSPTGITAFINTFTDTFDHGTINEINSTLSYLSYKNPNPDNSNSWIQQSNEAFASYTPSISDNPTTYPMRTIEVGKSSVNIQASLPNAFSGPGLAFWVTARGSWWAVGTYYSQSESTTYNCSDPGEGSSCPSDYTTTYNSANVGKRCTDPCTSSTTYSCGGTYTSTNCPPGPFAVNASNAGERCSCNSTCSDCSSTTTVYGCGGSTGGYSSCPNDYTTTHSAATVGRRCTDPCGTSTTTVYGCGENDSGTFCPDNFTTEYNAFTVGRRCSECTPSTTYSCGTVQESFFEPSGTVVATCTSSNVGSLCYKQYNSFTGLWEYANCSSTTTQSYTKVNSSEVTTYSYGVVTSTPVTTYTYSIVEASTTYYWNKIKEVTTVTYSSKLRIYSANGSSVVSLVDHIVGTDTSGYKYIYGIKADVANNTIEASAYSNESLTTQLGTTVSYTATSPTKSLSNGESSVGIIKLPVDQEGGSRLDNFKYTRV